MKNNMRKLIRDENGAAMILAVILLLVAGLVVASLLSFMGTALVVGPVYEGRVAELYGADAGVEDAVWKIQHSVDEVKELYCGAGNHTWTYPEAGDPAMIVNNRSLEVTMAYVNGTTFRVVSTATGDGSSTSVEAYLELEFFNLLSGALVSMSNIDLSKDCTVTGDVYYVGEITGRDYNHTEGTEMRIPLSVFPTQQQNEVFAQQFKVQALTGGTYNENNGNMNIEESGDLGPIYIPGNLVISTEVAINLKGVVYVGGYVEAAKELAITGAGSIVAEGDINLLKLADYSIAGDSIIMSLYEDIIIKKSDPDHELSLQALIYAPSGFITLDKDMVVLGGVIGAEVNIDKEGSFTYVSKTSSFLFPILVPNGAAIKTYNVIQN